MLLYWGKQVESEDLGARVLGVICDKCGCDYFYALRRVGTGSGTAPYGIGLDQATKDAQQRAKNDLGQRLTTEAELVPCPHCAWINDELVLGYRLGKYRGWGMIALGLGFFGTVGSFIAAWFIAIGPPVDR